MSKAELDPAFPYEHNFARIEAIQDTSVSFEFDLDGNRWPWLVLPPQHPVLIEQYQYFGSVTAGRALHTLAADQFNALTHYAWHCPVRAKAYARTGKLQAQAEGQKMHFEMNCFTDAGEHAIAMQGSGFTFSDRDFKAWRHRSRQTVLKAAGTREIELARPQLLGIDHGGAPFVSDPLMQGDQLHLLAQVFREQGFHPQHAFHTGSGDHVNAAQLLDCGLQAAHRLMAYERGDQSPRSMFCVGGRLQFHRFVELDAPFEMMLAEQGIDQGGLRSFRFTVHQAGRLNADIQLQFSADWPE